VNLPGSVAASLATLALVSCAAADPYRLADEAQRGNVVAAVRDYYATNARLSAGLSIDDFSATYPDLERKHDVTTGINLEAFSSKHWHESGASNYRAELEHYEPVHVWLRGASAIARVHGLEYLALHAGGETIGEFHTVLTLEQRGDRWQIVQTDEQMLGERPPTDPPTR